MKLTSPASRERSRREATRLRVIGSVHSYSFHRPDHPNLQRLNPREAGKVS